MDEHHATYRGHQIVAEPFDRIVVDDILEPTTRAEPALYIDGDRVFTFRDKAGLYIAAGFAYQPEGSLLNLAKRIIDEREQTGAAGKEDILALSPPSPTPRARRRSPHQQQ